MKNLYISLILATLVYSIGYSQCPLDSTHTDPNPMYVQPKDSGFKTNTFNWMMNPVGPINISGIPGSSNVSPPYNAYVTSPYFASEDYMAAIAKGTNSDYLPQDGWELIKQDMGYEAGNLVGWDTTAIPETCDNSSAPYIILYNKYEAKLRVFAIITDQEYTSAQNTEIVLEFAGSTEDNFSALFNNYNYPTQKALDQKTLTQKITGVCPQPKVPYKWIYADFPMAYDPCTCMFQSEIQVSFQSITTSTIVMTGRSLGVSIPLQDIENGSDTLPFNPNYVFSLQNLGSSQYNFGSLIQEFSSSETLANSLANPPPNFTDSTIKYAVNYLKAAAALYSASSGGPALIPTGSDSNYIKAATQAASNALLGKVAAAIGGTLPGLFNFASIPTSNYPLVTSSELILVGEDTTVTPEEGAGFTIANPGSLNAASDSEYGVCVSATAASYPMYNQPMGLFALLKTPYVHESYDNTEVSPYEFNPDSAYLPGIDFEWLTEPLMDYQFQLSDTAIQYALNPIVDASKTQIFAALEIDGMPNDTLNPSFYTLIAKDNLISEDTGKTSYNFERNITKFFPLGCLPSVITNESFSYNGLLSDFLATNGNTRNIDLVLSISYVFKPDVYGLVHTSYQLLKYPLIPDSVACHDATCMLSYDNVNFITFPDSLTMGTSVMGSDWPSTLYSYGTITIDGNITTLNPDSQYYIIAEQEIDVDSGATVAPNITLELSPFPPNLCTQPPTTPTLADSSYCHSSVYKANTPTGLARLTASNASIAPPLISKAFSASIYPNPATNELTININGLEDGQVNINIYDELGNQVYTQEFQSFGTSQNKFNISGLHLSDGVYLVKTTNGDNINNQRLVIAKP